MNLLYVNGSLVDLYPEQTIAINIKGIEAGKVNARFVSYTNSFSVPFSETNNRIFGYTNSEKSRGTEPYRLQDFKLVQNGIETFKGKLVVKSIDGKGYKIQLLDSLYDVFAEVNNKKFKELGTYGTTEWQYSDIDDAVTNTDGLVSAVMYFGRLFSGSLIYDKDFFLPSFYYHTAIKSILQATGCQISGSILSDARLTDLIIFFPGETYSENITTSVDYAANTTAQTQTIVDPTLSLGQKIAWAAGTNIVSDKYVAPTSYLGSVTLDSITATINIINATYTNATQIYAQLIKFDGVTETVLETSSTILGSSGTLSFFQTNVVVNDGDEIYIKVFTDTDTTPTATLDIVNTSTFVIDGPTVNETEVDWDSLWPEISCKDLLSDFTTRFNIIYKIKLNTLYLKSLEDIIEDRAGAVNWTTKLVKDIESISFELSLGQNNYFEYNNETLDESFGRGVMTIDNTTLEVDKTIYKTIFETAEEYESTLLFWKVATIPIYSDESADRGDFVTSPGYKLLTLKSRTVEPGIKFDPAGSTRTDYKMAYFVDGTLSKDTGFQYFVDQFYTNYESALQRNKVVVKYYYLTELDIQQYDPHKLIYDGDGYYIINQISNFIPGRITKVELFKVG